MRVLERVEGQVALFAHGPVAAQVSHQRVRELMQAERENPADEDNGESHNLVESFSSIELTN